VACVQDPQSRSISLACHKDSHKNYRKFYHGRDVGEKKEIWKQGLLLNETSKHDLGVSIYDYPHVQVARQVFKNVVIFFLVVLDAVRNSERSGGPVVWSPIK
jgi:hypothetical protein